jgi:hypothetical protein
MSSAGPHMAGPNEVLDPMSVFVGAGRPTLHVVNEGCPLERAYPQRRRTDRGTAYRYFRWIGCG